MTTKLIVITGFLVAFAAGLMVGARQRSEPAKVQVAMTTPTTGPTTQQWGRGGPRGPRSQSSMLVRELNLTSEQAQKMNEIFKKVADIGHELNDKRRSAQETRDNGIIALAQAEQNDKYEQILKQYQEESDKINEQWRDAYAAGIEQAKQILSDDQRKQYQEILTRNRWDGRGPEPWGRGPGGRRGLGGPPGADNRANGQPQLPQNLRKNGPTTGRTEEQHATTRPAPLN